MPIPAHRLVLLAGLLLAMSFAPPVSAQTGEAVRVTIPRLEGPPRLDEFAEMRPVGEVARAMARVEGFVTRFPRSDEPSSERTVVYLGYDDRALHAVFVCFDREPERLRSPLAPRDRVSSDDDSVSLQLDTFRDLRHAYGFQVNPAGVQLDARWTEGAGWDLSFDTTWKSDGRITPRGYLVLFSIPFRSLRFPPTEVQEWGLLLYRGIARNNEWSFWPRYSLRIAGRMNQAALLQGIEGISPGRNGEIVPYLNARSLHLPSPREATAAGGAAGSSLEDSELDVGVDAKVVVKDSVALDLTVRPDFSQVESDEPQATVNNRFELFFPEKRPFFLENASYFDTPIQLFFSRRILEPEVGARATGRIGSIALGALAVEDRPSGLPDARVGVLRLGRDIGEQSSVGVFASSWSAGGTSQRVVSLDSRIKLAPRWVSTLQAVKTMDRTEAGTRSSGTAYEATLQRSGERLDYQAELSYRSPDFRAAIGFVERSDILALDQQISYRRRPSDSRLLSWGPDLVVEMVRDSRGRSVDWSVVPKLSFEWPGQTRLTVFYEDARVGLRPSEVPSVEVQMALDSYRMGVELTSSFSRRLALEVEAASGTAANLAPQAGASPELGDLEEARVALRARPSNRWSVDTDVLWTRLATRSTGRSVFTDRILRARIGFQFTRALSVRAIAQHDRLETYPGATSLASRGNVNFDLLLTWFRTPGRALYVGYNSNRVDRRPGLGADGARRRSDFATDASQFFVKLSYSVPIRRRAADAAGVAHPSAGGGGEVAWSPRSARSSSRTSE